MASIETLAKLATQLSLPGDNKDEKMMMMSSDEGSAQQQQLLLVWQDDEDGDFSSFPSLSLEESPGNYHTGNFTSRGDVETHVESLLSRPILLGKKPAEDDERSSAGLEAEADDSLDEFFAESLEEVPKLMMSNFCTSFATLMNSRLRAYATFLARHALSMARCSKTDQEMEGVIGIEHKLETMLGIGSQVSTGAVCSELTIDQAKLPEVIPAEGDDAASQVSLPLKMKISVTIALPHVKEVDGKESMQVSFETTGKICGIFAKDGQEPCLLRVAEVILNMHELLTAMAEEAARVISCIVEMTNTAFAIPLLPTTPEGEGATSIVEPVERKKRKAHQQEAEDNDDQDDIVSLSAEKCATIVDCVIGELDDDLLSPRTVKKIKVLHPPLA